MATIRLISLIGILSRPFFLACLRIPSMTAGHSSNAWLRVLRLPPRLGALSRCFLTCFAGPSLICVWLLGMLDDVTDDVGVANNVEIEPPIPIHSGLPAVFGFVVLLGAQGRMS